ncbi:hypothetical protein BDR26DRAFT_856213 [Obelidium mucronatum]|nr:hypothetical protein BDR26DRAFT_856213 [Obelidium mucronatum]
MSQPLQQQQVTVGTITGKQFTVSIQPTDTVRDVKIRIEEEEAIPLETQVLMFKEKPLKDTAAIRDLGIRGGSRLQLAVHMTAGPGPITRVRKPKKDDSVVVQQEIIPESDISRSTSSYSSLSTTTFLSMLNTQETFSPDTRNVNQSEQSRKSSPQFSSSARSLSKTLEVKRRDQANINNLLNPRKAVASPPSTSSMSTCIIKKKIRPATAISIMRTLQIVCTRPSTASHIIQSENLKPSPPASLPSLCKLPQLPYSGTTSPQNMDRAESVGTIIEIEAIEETQRKSISRSESQSKSVRFSPANINNSSSHEKPPTNPTKTPLKTARSSTPLVASLPPLTLRKKSARYSPPKREALVSRSVGTSASGKKSNEQKPPPPPVVAVQKPTNCFQCNKKLGPVAVFKCKCSHYYCSSHRYSDRHDCKFNYKEAGRAMLMKENPKVGGNKVHKI